MPVSVDKALRTVRRKGWEPTPTDDGLWSLAHVVLSTDELIALAAALVAAEPKATPTDDPLPRK